MKKLALDLQLLTLQILTNDVQALILCLSYFIHYVLRAWKTFNVASWMQTPIFETQMS